MTTMILLTCIAPYALLLLLGHSLRGKLQLLLEPPRLASCLMVALKKFRVVMNHLHQILVVVSG
jgi:hypothetical protein